MSNKAKQTTFTFNDVALQTLSSDIQKIMHDAITVKQDVHTVAVKGVQPDTYTISLPDGQIAYGAVNAPQAANSIFTWPGDSGYGLSGSYTYTTPTAVNPDSRVRFMKDVVTFEVPGHNKEDITVTWSNGTLSVTAATPAFSRRVWTYSTVVPTHVTIKNGILSVHLSTDKKEYSIEQG